MELTANKIVDVVQIQFTKEVVEKIAVGDATIKEVVRKSLSAYKGNVPHDVFVVSKRRLQEHLEKLT